MLLSKVNEIDSTKKEKSTLETENEVLKNEKRELTKRISELEKINEGLNGEIQLNKNDIKSYLNNISKLKEDYETKFREYTLLKDSSSKMKIDFDRDLSKLEGDVKRSEEQVKLNYLFLDIFIFIIYILHYYLNKIDSSITT